MSDINSTIKFQENFMNAIAKQNAIFEKMSNSNVVHAINKAERITSNIDNTKFNEAVLRINESSKVMAQTLERLYSNIPYEEIYITQQAIKNMNINYVVPSIEKVANSIGDFSSVIARVQNQINSLNDLMLDSRLTEADLKGYSSEITIDISKLNYNDLLDAIDNTQEGLEELQESDTKMNELNLKLGFINRIEIYFGLEPGKLKDELESYTIGKIIDLILTILLGILISIMGSSPETNYINNINIDLNIELNLNTQTNQSEIHYLKKRLDYLENILLLGNQNAQMLMLTRDNYIYTVKKRNSRPITKAQQGNLLLKLKKERNWTKVGYYNEEYEEYVVGWVFTRYLEKVGN